jgi:gliding motility-associated-like protein
MGQSLTQGGTYTATLKNTAGCDSVATLNLTIITPLNIVTNPITTCSTADLTAPSVTTGSDPGLTYTYWMDNATTIVLANPAAVALSGMYYIKATSVTGCNAVKGVEIKVEKAAVGIRYPAITTVPNQSTTLSARFLGNNYTYLWTPPEGLNSNKVRTPIFKHDKEMQYLISMISNAGCITVDTLQVVLRQAIPSSCTPDIFVPKAWSPNRDGHNDKLFPFVVCMKEMKSFKVYNRWGELMFETNVIGNGWDGLYRGHPMVSEVYTWTVEAIGVDDKYYKRSGNSVLLR